jgi:hypothetical protein
MNSPATRKTLVERLVRFEGALASTMTALHEFGWDCDEELVSLKPSHIGSVLNRYLSGSVADAEVEAWANAIECREDIEFGDLIEIVFELANPAITRPLSPVTAQDLLSDLGRPAT